MGHKDVFKEIFGMNDFTNYAIIIRMEVPPTLDQPASQQGGGGKVENLTGGVRAEMEERWSGQEFFGGSRKVKVFIQSVLFRSLVCCGLAGITMYQFSAESKGRRGFG